MAKGFAGLFMDALNNFAAYGERLLNRGMDIANNYVTYGERLVSKGLARAEQITRQVALRGQQQMFGRPPFTAPSYGI